MIDLNADIVPGTSAAGFRIGQTFADIQLAELSHHVVRKWDESQGQLGFAIEETEDWLLSEVHVRTRPKRPLTFLYFNRGMVTLHFNAGGILYWISVWNGYRGCFADAIQIGDRLDKVLTFTNLFHDSGDEMHYPAEDSPIRGIGFIAEDRPLEDAPDQIIRGISVQDWSLQWG
jgi:hypothetical protein